MFVQVRPLRERFAFNANRRGWNEYEITQHLPSFLLDYREEITGATRWDDRVVSTSGDWSGNLFDFHQMVIPRLFSTLKSPFVLKLNGGHEETDPVRESIHEAVANALVHAFYGSQSMVKIVRSADGITVTNSGVFLIDKDIAIEGGTTEARNPTLMRIFGLVRIADRAGSGLCSMYSSWRKAFGVSPQLDEHHRPAEVVLTLPFEGVREGTPAGIDHDLLIRYIQENPGTTPQVVARRFGVGARAAQVVLKKECDAGRLERHRSGRAFAYWAR
jgi:predicted HTH transcriptional regulator